jgi:hypothetical protein
MSAPFSWSNLKPNSADRPAATRPCVESKAHNLTIKARSHTHPFIVPFGAEGGRVHPVVAQTMRDLLSCSPSIVFRLVTRVQATGTGVDGEGLACKNAFMLADRAPHEGSQGLS